METFRQSDESLVLRYFHVQPHFFFGARVDQIEKNIAGKG